MGSPPWCFVRQDTAVKRRTIWRREVPAVAYHSIGAGMYVTQSRPYGEEDFQYWLGTSQTPLLFTGLPRGTETTTSFRTGRRDNASAEDAQFDSVNSSAGLFGELAKEYKRDRAASTSDNGHTFDTNKTKVDYISHRSHEVLGFNGAGSSGHEQNFRYQGPLVPVFSGAPGGGPTQAYPPLWSGSSTNQVVIDGTKLINATIPTLPQANLSQTLVETVREGIPKMVGSQLLSMRDTVRAALGGEYLNIEFGWKPLISDLTAALHAVVSAGELLRQLERDSGRNIRRRRSLPEVKDSYSTFGTGQLFQPSTLGTNGPTYWARAFTSRSGPASFTETKTTKKWFSGAYTYHLAPNTSAMNKVKRAQQQASYLLGLELTPELLWEVAPWSWLSDWVLNIGENISNATRLSADDLVLRYGYLMVHRQTNWHRTLSGISTFRHGPVGDLFLTTTSERKERYRATPFGFGINTEAFTGRQWAILGALGMTRGPQTVKYND
jgi:hypothetical protein